MVSMALAKVNNWNVELTRLVHEADSYAFDDES